MAGPTLKPRPSPVEGDPVSVAKTQFEMKWGIPFEDAKRLVASESFGLIQDFWNYRLEVIKTGLCHEASDITIRQYQGAAIEISYEIALPEEVDKVQDVINEQLLKVARTPQE